jgi:ferredoxin
MNFLSAAERLAAIDRSAVSYHPERCLHEIDRFAECTACVDSCPSGAIQAGKPPVLNAERCVGCLACLVACPTGAYSADDSVSALLSCAARLETKNIEILCANVPAPESGPGESYHALLVRGCLASLGKGALLAIAALGFDQIVLRTTACAGCPWGQVLHPMILRQARQASFLLSLVNSDRKVLVLEQVEAGNLVQRPVWDVHNPPLTRRDLFLMASRQGQIALARAMNPEKIPGRSPGRERQRLNAALAHMSPADLNWVELPQEFGFAVLRVDDRCTACGACARVCPTRALRFENLEDKSYRLWFTPSACIACGACLHVCVEEALQIDDTPPVDSIFLENPLVLDEGEFTRCSRCRALIPRRLGRNLCPLCAYRVEHPFGSNLPPALQRKMAARNRQVSQ